MKSIIYIIFFALFLSMVGILVKLTSNVNIMTITFYRSLFAFLVLLIICPLLDKNTFKVTKKDLLGYLLIGFLFALSMSLTNLAFLHAPINNIVLIWSTYPFFVFIFAYFLLKEKVTKTKIITLIIAIIGLAFVNPINPIGLIGNILALIVAALDGFLFTLMRKADLEHGIGDVMWFFLFSTIFLLPFPFIFGFKISSVTIPLIGVVTAIAFIFYNLALQKMEVEIASITDIIIYPIFAISFAVLILEEAISWNIIVGGIILILAGIYLEFHNKKIKE